MCDEYDDERMWAYGRRLDIQGELKQEERDAKQVEAPVPIAFPVTPEMPRVRPQTLTH